MYYDKVSKIYIRKDGRRQVDAYHDGKKTSTLYSRYLMEQELGRELTFDETVDHLNRDKADDRIENLRVVSRSQHSIDDSIRVRDVSVECVWCGYYFTILGNKVRQRLRGKAGPFCSRSCSGKYGKSVQINRVKMPPQEHKREYFFLDKNNDT